jgi:hypothetical protein
MLFREPQSQPIVRLMTKKEQDITEYEINLRYAYWLYVRCIKKRPKISYYVVM